MAAAMQVVQRARKACSPANASCLLVFPACPLLKLRDYDEGQLPKGVREPKDINVCPWHVGNIEAFTSTVPWHSSCICAGIVARSERVRAGTASVKNKNAVQR